MYCYPHVINEGTQAQLGQLIHQSHIATPTSGSQNLNPGLAFFKALYSQPLY